MHHHSCVKHGHRGFTRFFPEYDASILVADGNSTDRTIRLAESFRTPPQIEKIVMRKSGETGKGGAIRDIMRVATKANMLAIVDNDLISITPSWMDHLLRPIAFGIADFTTPRYIRDKHDGGVTKLLTYPMITTLFGDEIRQPMGGEVGLSSELIRCCLDHPLSPDDWGIDTFITFVALANGLRIQEAPLGPKFHESTSKYVKPSTIFFQCLRRLSSLFSA
ncbi:MAG: glycosyltransferase [Methanocellales archaeon]|nr:glycosyltransferase [Methanocellales archaeon]